MPKLVISQKNFIGILQEYGFYHKRTHSSHQTWEGFHHNKKWLVQVDTNYNPYSGWLLNSMIRQSGLDKRIFIEFKK